MSATTPSPQDAPAMTLAGELDELAAVAHASKAVLAEPVARMRALWIEAIAAGRKIILFGNGGSAAEAQHLAAEIVVRMRKTRRALPALALTTDTSILTAAANDFGYDQVFARQIEALGQPGDVAVGLTTSGRSPNVRLAFEAARAQGLSTCALTGEGGDSLAALADIVIAVPSRSTARIQELHLAIGHHLCIAVEEAALARLGTT